ncbi:uncharacterized protein LOC125304380 isoform X1 [Alosa alosa]|uniref:uncharacterized protein LOC125304380 isoform X1 n=1 Tax=Alosa alosa TaxID=278164 RepID=UPI002015285D|nr:uncharacterized protein LOC125304380 isoform X1 [Alosa alosa]XP_048114573.1 uncharacterized protein LOC125304380 isoform X1 [Alosa alosa]
MEKCMARPEAKKRKPAQPRPPSAPPRPPKLSSELSGNRAETQGKENTVETPAAPLKPSDAVNMNRIQRERMAQTPVIPPKPTEKELRSTVAHRRYQTSKPQDNQNENTATPQPVIPPRLSKQIPKEKDPEVSEAAKDETDIRQGNVAMLTEMFQKGPKEQAPTFKSYISDSDPPKSEEKPEPEKPIATENKKGGFKGMLNKTNLFKSQASVDNDLSAEEPDPEKEQSGDEVEEKRLSEGKHGKGFMAGMFWGLQKEKTSASVLRVSPAASDAENTEEGGPEETKEKGLFHGIFKKPQKSDVAEEGLSHHLSASNDSLSDTSIKEKGGIFSGIFKKPKPSQDGTPEQDNLSVHSNLSGSDDDNLSENSNKAKGKGGMLTGMFKKTPKSKQPPKPSEDDGSIEDLSAHSELSASNDNLSEEKGLFSGIFKKAFKATDEDKRSLHDELSLKVEPTKKGVFKKKSPKSTENTPADEFQDRQSLKDELSRSTDDLCENSAKERGNAFSGLFRKSQKHPEDAPSEEDKRSLRGELSASEESLSDKPKEKSGIFGGMFKKAPKPSEEDKDTQEKGGVFGGMFKKSKPCEGSDEDKDSLSAELSASTDDLCENSKPKEKGGVFGGMFKKSKPREGSDEDKDSLSTELSASTDDLSDNNKTKEKQGVFGMFKKPKARESSDEDSLSTELSASTDDLSENTKPKEKGGMFGGMFKKPKAREGCPPDEDNALLDKNLSASNDSLSDNTTTSKEKTTGLSGMFRRSPKPALRSQASTDPLNQFSELSESNDSLADFDSSQDLLSVDPQLSGSKDNLLENNNAKEKKGMLGIFRRSPRPAEQAGTDADESQGLVRKGRSLKKKRVVSFRVKRTLPRMPKFSLNPSAQSASKEPLLEEPVELQEILAVQETTEEQVEIQEVEMAAFPTEGNPLEVEGDGEGLLDWWRTVEGWAQWNETTNFQEDEEQEAVEAVADRVFMAARLFVLLFNQRGAKLQQYILELLAQADAVDQFHKKTVSAAVGGGVASVAGSVATITGLILAPFTFGASIIVTAVGISVATAGSITSATANITDTVHAKMDRKKVEQMIQNYQDEIKDIRECLEFVQEGMNTLEDWNFQKYSESVAQKHMHHNIKHVMKEGGRAGKALMINTDQLISTVQVLGVAGGAAKAAQAVSITTGVMSALFLALDVFFLAKDSHELHKGAKTKFATQIREVCKELQDGLLELNKVKCQLQKTMYGIELEEYVEEEEEEDEDDLESDPVKLAQLEQELDQLEEKLDKKVLEEPSKRGEMEKEEMNDKGKEKETKSEKEKKNENEKKKEGMIEKKSEIEEDRKSVKSEGGDLEKRVKEQKEEMQEGKKMEKSKIKLIGEAPKKDTEKGVATKSNKKERDGKSEKGESEKDKDSVMEKAKERPERKMYPFDKHNRSEREERECKRSVQSSASEMSVTKRATQDKAAVMKQEDETKKGKARSEKGTRDSKRETERQTTRSRRVEEDEERGSRRGSRTDVELKEGGQAVTKPKQEGAGQEERGGVQRESAKRRDREREVRGERLRTQEGGTSRESLVGRGEEDYGRRREREGERRGSRQEYGSERGGVEGRSHTSLRGRSAKERNEQNRGSRLEHDRESRGGEERRGSRQDNSAEKQKEVAEWDSSKIKRVKESLGSLSERENRERKREGNGKKPELSTHTRSIRQDGLDI